MGKNSQVKLFENGIHKQPFEKKIENMNKNAHKCLKVLARAHTFLLLIIFLTMGMNSTAKTIRKWYP